jgi:hypothetical protein
LEIKKLLGYFVSLLQQSADLSLGQPLIEGAPLFGGLAFIQRFIMLFDDFFDLFMKLLQFAGFKRSDVA